MLSTASSPREIQCCNFRVKSKTTAQTERFSFELSSLSRCCTLFQRHPPSTENPKKLTKCSPLPTNMSFIHTTSDHPNLTTKTTNEIPITSTRLQSSPKSLITPLTHSNHAIETSHSEQTTKTQPSQLTTHSRSSRHRILTPIPKRKPEKEIGRAHV